MQWVEKPILPGTVTTTGHLLEPAGDMEYGTLMHVYQEQIGVLAETGVDLIVIETMMGTGRDHGSTGCGGASTSVSFL